MGGTNKNVAYEKQKFSGYIHSFAIQMVVPVYTLGQVRAVVLTFGSALHLEGEVMFHG